jgi:hypothetical protein
MYVEQNIREYDDELQGKGHHARVGLRRLERTGTKLSAAIGLDALRYIFPEPSMHIHIRKEG